MVFEKMDRDLNDLIRIIRKGQGDTIDEVRARDLFR